MSLTGMTFNEFCQSVAEQEREDRAARRRWLRMLRESRKASLPDEMGAEQRSCERTKELTDG